MSAGSQPQSFRFPEVAVLPQAHDNVAISKTVLRAGTVLTDLPASATSKCIGDDKVVLKQSVLEGHRFALHDIDEGQSLCSWGLPFGVATSKIAKGNYVLNVAMSKALTGRSLVPGDAELEDFALEQFTTEEKSNLDLVEEVLEGSEINFIDLDVTPNRPFVIDTQHFVGMQYNASRGWKIEEERRSRSSSSAATLLGEEDGFLGYQRSTLRGVGTRNHVVIFALTSLAAPLVRSFEAKYRQQFPETDNFDGVRIGAHTEGETSEGETLHNESLLIRTLCGWLCHSNVGAAIVVSTGVERHLSMESLQRYSQEHSDQYDTSCFTAPFLTHAQYAPAANADEISFATNGSEAPVQSMDAIVQQAVGYATEGVQRTRQPLGNLRIALQCGGSDAFSGIHGNPLAGMVAEELGRRYGVASNLAESPELIGAEHYILENAASVEVAETFIGTTERYKKFAADHDQSAAGNPSGGNLFRGLYNIVLKSLGAARKKPPTTTLDGVLQYSEPMLPRQRAIAQEVTAKSAGKNAFAGAYFFMDSPGNDLESIAGQVASGSNMIFFITGNGAMTNFPFVPTLKIVTTTRRFRKLAHEMDIDAGGFTRPLPPAAEGTGIPSGGIHHPDDVPPFVEEVIALVKDSASGRRTKGEEAQHSQVSIWRNWASTSKVSSAPSASGRCCGGDRPVSTTGVSSSLDDGSQLVAQAPPTCVLRTQQVLPPGISESALLTWLRSTSYNVGIIVPTSLCSSEIARAIVTEYNRERYLNLRWVTPVHTEGCGVAGDRQWEWCFLRLLLGYACHPSVQVALFLEHGCEKTHNDVFHGFIRDQQDGLTNDPAKFGFQSIQKDGGIGSVKGKLRDFFSQRISSSGKPTTTGITHQQQLTQHCTIGVDIYDGAGGNLQQTKKRLSPLALQAITRFLTELCEEMNVNLLLPEDSLLLGSQEFLAATTKEERKEEGSCKVLRFGQSLRPPGNEPPSGLRGCVFVMEGLKPSSLTRAEWISGLSVSCDLLLTIVDGPVANIVSGSTLVPTLRLVWPKEVGSTGMWLRGNHDGNLGDGGNDGKGPQKVAAHWMAILKSATTNRKEVDSDPDSSLLHELFRHGEFVVPRGAAVSM